MSPRMHVRQLFHVIVKHTMATETSTDYQPGNMGLLCALSTHRTQTFNVTFSPFSQIIDQSLVSKKQQQTNKKQQTAQILNWTPCSEGVLATLPLKLADLATRAESSQ